jgi:hypothetical protein
MDRSSFLSSLPFFIPIASSSWPPRTTAPRSSTSNGNGNEGVATTTVRSERLLQDHYSVSIEPVARHCNDETSKASTGTTTPSIITLGPAFFGSNNSLTTADESSLNNFDPALCSLEMVLECTDNNIINNNSNDQYGGHYRNNSSPPHHHNHHRHQNASASTVSYTGIAHVRLQGQGIFQLDLSELASVQVQEPPDGDVTSLQPACLVLRFSAVAVLRIFSLVAVPADEHFHLQAVCNKITTAAVAASTAASAAASNRQMAVFMTTTQSPGGCSSHVGGSSCNSSTTDTGAVANYRYEKTGAAEGEHNYARQEDSISRPSTRRPLAEEQDKDQENPRDRMERRMQRRRLAYGKSMAGMQALETLLDMPVSTFSADRSAMTVQATASAVLMDRMGPLLSAIGDDLTNAYARQGDKAQAMQACESNLVECRTALDDNLKAFFPLPRSKQRLLTTKSSAAMSAAAGCNGGNSKVDAGVDVAEIGQQMEELVQRQKEAVRKRHELFLLPSRG